MESYLVFPNHRTAREFGYTGRRTPITWTREHPLSSLNLGILLDEYGNPFDWYWLRLLRDRAGAYVETSDLTPVRRALGLLPGEHHDLSDYIKPLHETKSDAPSSLRADVPITQ